VEDGDVGGGVGFEPGYEAVVLAAEHGFVIAEKTPVGSVSVETGEKPIREISPEEDGGGDEEGVAEGYAAEEDREEKEDDSE